jgi:trigger factor
MQVSVETTSSIERRMTIGVPADQIEQEVEQRLQKTAKTAKINGFRPGKVPVKQVKKLYGKGLRQEVIGEVMRNAYVEALTQEKVSPVGYPRFEPKTVEEGKDLEFIAIFEVYPEIELADLSELKLETPTAEIKEKDIKAMIDTLRRQHGTLKSVKRKSKKKDQLTLDYTGYIGEEAFQGGTGKDQKITLGAGQMIPGFEDGLIGSKAGESVTLELTFPEDYANEELAGKDVKFDVDVKVVEDIVLPEMDEEFFSKYGVDCKTEEDFKAEVVKNMGRELENSVSNKLKQQIVEGLSEANEVDVPASMVDEEINRMKQEAMQQFGGGAQLDPAQLPNELFQDQATQRVKTGLLFAAVVKDNEIVADAAAVDAKIQEIAESYETPAEVIEFYGKQENRAQVEAVVVEDAVVELVKSKAKGKKVKMSYEDAVKPAAPKAAKEEA